MPQPQIIDILAHRLLTLNLAFSLAPVSVEPHIFLIHIASGARLTTYGLVSKPNPVAFSTPCKREPSSLCAGVRNAKAVSERDRKWSRAGAQRRKLELLHEPLSSLYFNAIEVIRTSKKAEAHLHVQLFFSLHSSRSSRPCLALRTNVPLHLRANLSEPRIAFALHYLQQRNLAFSAPESHKILQEAHRTNTIQSGQSHSCKFIHEAPRGFRARGEHVEFGYKNRNGDCHDDGVEFSGNRRVTTSGIFRNPHSEIKQWNPRGRRIKPFLRSFLIENVLHAGLWETREWNKNHQVERDSVSSIPLYSPFVIPARKQWWRSFERGCERIRDVF